MKRIVILIVIFSLTACVPIQPDDLHAPEPRAKGGLAELARVFAAMDQQDDSSEYLALLLEFEACILEAWENEGNEFEKEFTDEETVVLVMHTVSTFMMGIMFQLDYEQEDGVEFERQQYQLLILSVDFCRGDVD